MFLKEKILFPVKLTKTLIQTKLKALHPKKKLHNKKKKNVFELSDIDFNL